MFEARMRVVHDELWAVEAKDEADARKKLIEISPEVQEDKTGGEVVYWEIKSIRPMKD
jgi:hypothetical protein